MSIQLQNGQFIALGKQLYCMARKPETGESLFDKSV